MEIMALHRVGVCIQPLAQLPAAVVLFRSSLPQVVLMQTTDERHLDTLPQKLRELFNHTTAAQDHQSMLQSSLLPPQTSRRFQGQ